MEDEIGAYWWERRLRSPLTSEQWTRIHEHNAAQQGDHAYIPAFDDSGHCLWCLDVGIKWAP